MQHDTDRLTFNVNQILHLGRIEDKKLVLNLQEVEIKSYIKEFLDKHPHYFNDIKITLDITNSEDQFCNIDPDLFEMVIMNIITNSINHNQMEKCELHISFQSIGDLTKIFFKDNGVGIALKEQKNVFKKMYQVGRSSKGSGIGLYLSTNVMRLHKGSLKLESEGIGSGATFIVTLPEVRK